MRENRKTNLVIVASLLMIAAAFAAYAALVLRWFASPPPGAPAAAAAPGRAEAEAALAGARRAFRERLLDPRAHLRLSDALWRAGRPVDSFYVTYAARQLFPDDAFRKAHAEAVLGAGGPAAAARARLAGLTDPALAVPIHAEAAREYPDAPEGRDSADQLSRLASGDESAAGGDAARLARTALEELYRDRPKDWQALAALGAAWLARGDQDRALALAREALSKRPGDPGAARIMGMLALKSRDLRSARTWLTRAWEGDPNDLYSAAKLAQIYDKAGGDAEGALPYYMALYRQNPDYADGDETAETRIRETLDARRENLLKDAPVAGLGGRFRLDDASLRAEAALRAAAFKDPRWIDALGELLDDDCEIVRRNADYALYEIAKAEPDAVRARREAWLSSDSPLARIRALNLFADLDGKNAFPSVVSALRDPNPGVRAFAKVMVLDHYYKDLPEAAKARARYFAEEKDPEALAFARRFAEGAR